MIAGFSGTGKSLLATQFIAEGIRQGKPGIVTETAPSHRKATAMNQALMIGSVRQHELTDAAERLNGQLQVKIAEHKRAEEELRRANEDLNQFAFAASHDLREPLCTITAFRNFWRCATRVRSTGRFRRALVTFNRARAA